MDDPTTPEEIQQFVLHHYGREALIAGGRYAYAEKCEMWAEVFGVVTDKTRHAELQRQEAEQAAFDAAYLERKKQEWKKYDAERALEREASRDEVFVRRKRAPTHRHHTDVPKRRSEYFSTDEYDFITASVALPVGVVCPELMRSTLDLLSDHEQPLHGFTSNAHSRRRAFFSRYHPSRSVTLARAA